MFIRTNQELIDFLKKVEGETSMRIAEKVDAAKCLPFQDLKLFIASLPIHRQEEFAGLLKYEDLILGVQHKNEMKVFLNSCRSTMRVRQRRS